MSSFALGLNPHDAASNEAQIDTELQASLPGYDPKRAGLSYWQKKAFARLMADIGDLHVEGRASMFRFFAEKIAKIPPILAAPATVYSTWTVIDEEGHTIKDGTEVKIPVDADNYKAFVVVGDVVIPLGKDTTAAGEVLLQAKEPGVAGNELSGEPTPISADTAFVDSIELTGVTDGGVDEEGEDEYLERAVMEARLFSTSLVVKEDFEIDAITFPGVARALCLPAWNGDEGKAEALCFTVVALTAAGQAPGETQRDALLEHQAEKVPSGVENFVGVPTFTKLDVLAEFSVLPGFDPEVVKAAVQARLASYLDPANSGLPSGFGDPGSIGGWAPASAVYRNELITEVSNVPGVDRVVTLKLAKTGSELETQESVALAGVAPLTEPGTLTVAAV